MQNEQVNPHIAFIRQEQVHDLYHLHDNVYACRLAESYISETDISFIMNKILVKEILTKVWKISI